MSTPGFAVPPDAACCAEAAAAESSAAKATVAEIKASVKGKDLLRDAFKAFAEELGIPEDGLT